MPKQNYSDWVKGFVKDKTEVPTSAWADKYAIHSVRRFVDARGALWEVAQTYTSRVVTRSGCIAPDGVTILWEPWCTQHDVFLEPKTQTDGFTLIELVMVVLLLAVLAAVAIPNFDDFRADARNSAVKGALGGMRAAIAIARAAIALKEDIAPPPYPTAAELQANSYNGSHPLLNALATQNKRIMDPATGVPVNPWSLTTVPSSQQASIWDCSALTKGIVRSGALQQDFGWCYNSTTGEMWANSDRNGSASPDTENRY